MPCALCSAATFGPLVQGGVSVAKIAERARRAADSLSGEDRANVHACADTLNLLAAELALRENSG